MGPTNLAKIKAAHEKLMRLDPEYAARSRRIRRDRVMRARINVAREIDASLRNLAVEPQKSPLLAVSLDPGVTSDWARGPGPVWKSTFEKMLKPTKPVGGAKGRVYTFNEETKTLTEWAASSGVSRSTLKNRLRLGWTLEAALSLPIRANAAMNRPPRKPKRLFTYDGESLGLEQWSNRTGIHFQTLRARLRIGWSIERAITVPVKRKMATGGCAQTFEGNARTTGGGVKNSAPNLGKNLTGQNDYLAGWQ